MMKFMEKYDSECKRGQSLKPEILPKMMKFKEKHDSECKRGQSLKPEILSARNSVRAKVRLVTLRVSECRRL